MDGKFMIGDKAIIIKSYSGNEGKIVEVIGYYNQMDFMYGLNWPDADIIIQSLGFPFNVNDRQSNVSIAPIESINLRKLPKVDEEIELKISVVKYDSDKINI